jgi:DNA repair protein RadC
MSTVKNHPLVKWASEMNEIKMAYKNGKPAAKDLPQITSSTDMAKMFEAFYDSNNLLIADYEYMLIAFLNRANRVLGIQIVSQGGTSGTVCDPKVVLRAAILMNASNIALSHNHPSGNLRPSNADRELTQKIKEGAKYMDVCLIDHVIVTPSGQYYSFADEGNI